MPEYRFDIGIGRICVPKVQADGSPYHQRRLSRQDTAIAQARHPDSEVAPRPRAAGAHPV
jgi:hypothetical protein